MRSGASAAMRVGVATYDVPAACEVAHLCCIEKAGRANAAGGDEEMAAPSELFEHSGDGRVEGSAAVVEGEEHRRRPRDLTAASDERNGPGRHSRTNGLKLAGKILAAELVDVGALAGKAAGVVGGAFHYAVIHDCQRPHGTSSQCIENGT